jgi:hypothetical protein
MKRFLMLILLMMLVPLVIYAGQVYGSLLENGQPVPEGTEVVISCGGRTIAGRTDKDGSYRVYAGENGKCTFKVVHKRQEVLYDIYSYTKPVRYDFDLVLENNRYILRRR